MNKKFFTLLVAFLATISFGAFAQVTPVYGVTPQDIVDGNGDPIYETGTTNPEFPYDAEQTYLLKIGDNSYLGVDKNKGLVVKSLSAVNSYAKLDSISWYIEYTPGSTSGTNPTVATAKYTSAAIEGLVLELNPRRIVDIDDIDDVRNDANRLGTFTDGMDVWVASRNFSVPATDIYFVSDEEDRAVAMYVVEVADGDDRVVPVRFENTEALLAAANDATNPDENIVRITPQLIDEAKFPAFVPDGVFVLQVMGSSVDANVGSTIKMSLGGTTLEYVKEARQEYQHMPSAQWIIKTTGTGDGIVSTSTNREFADQTYFDGTDGELPLFATRVNGTFYVELEGGAVDTVAYTPVSSVTDKYLGYWYHGEKNKPENMTISFRYLHELSMDNPIILNNEDQLYVSTTQDDPYIFNLLSVNENVFPAEYGYPADETTGNLASLVKLERTAYYIGKRLGGSLLEEPEWQFVAYNEADKKYYLTEAMTVADMEDAEDNIVPFYLKENNEVTYEVEGEDNKTNSFHYYVLLHANPAGVENEDTNDDGTLDQLYAYSKVSVNPNTLALVNGVLDDNANQEVANSAFRVMFDGDNQNGYRHLGDVEGENEKMDAVKFYRVNQGAAHPYLYEDANSAYSTLPIPGLNTPAKDRVEGEYQINFLGVEGKGDDKKSVMNLRYIRGKEMPQYLISVAEAEHKATEAEMCPVCKEIVENGGTRPANCPHDVKAGEGYIDGRFLVNLVDSVYAEGDWYDFDSEMDNRFTWESKYTRLAFVNARLKTVIELDEDDKEYEVLKLVIGHDEFILSPFEYLTGQNKDTDEKELDGLYSPVLFSFRLIETDSNNFLIESESAAEVEDDTNPYFAGRIYPTNNGGWVKYQNGVPVIANYATSGEAFNQAEIWNWELAAEGEEATSNEGITEGTYEVTAGTGIVTIKGAAGKQVVIANILGKVITNVTLGSDYETISVPAGVVVVSVDGEATKALVK